MHGGRKLRLIVAAAAMVTIGAATAIARPSNEARETSSSIVFVQGTAALRPTTIERIDPDGHRRSVVARAVAFGSLPALSTDQKTICFARSNANDVNHLFTVPTDGGVAKPLGIEGDSCSISQSGDELAYVPGVGSAHGANEVWIARRQGRKWVDSRQVAAGPGDCCVYEPYWAATGRIFFLVSRGPLNVWSVLPDGTGLRALTHYTEDVSDVESIEHFAPTLFSRYSVNQANNRSVYFDLFTQPCESCHDFPVGFIKDSGRGGVHLLYLAGPHNSLDVPSCPVIAPDGRNIAYGTRSGLWVAKLADPGSAKLVLRVAAHSAAQVPCPLVW